MKAVVFHQHGGPEALRFEEVPTPAPGPGEVRVRLRAAALNHLDIWVRMGLRGPRIPMPHIGGSDGAGEVDAAGAGVADLKAGDRVLLCPGLRCGRCPACARGEDSLCADYRLIGYQVQGTYAEAVVVPRENVLPIPAGMPFEEAAALPLVGITAHHMLVARAGVRPGETAVVMAAGSGVGSMAVQLAKAFGARVIATAGTDAKCARARELGADETINYAAGDLEKEVRRLTGGAGADVIIEHTGGPLFTQALACLGRGGRLVTCGATGGAEASFDIRSLFVRHVSLLGSYMGGLWELHAVLRLAAQGRVRAVVDRTFPLAEAADAQRRMEARANTGKIVLAI
jgi:NADPH:quinone reductase-like Zn-dependent oxidoreductase